MRLIIADDHTLFRRSLRALLEAKGFEVVGEADDGEQVLALARELRPDIILMDLDMPNLGGLAATRKLTAELPDLRVVVLTGSYDEDYLLEALEAGAQGYLMKTLEPDKLFEMLDGVIAGQPALAPALAHKALQSLARRGREEPTGRPDPLALTDREREVLRLMAGGVTSTRALAGRLGVSERTIKFHVGNLLDKLQVGSRAEAVGHALRHDLVEPLDE